jgi:hypothetical protein
MSKKAAAAVVLVCLFALAGGGAGLFTLFYHPSPPTNSVEPKETATQADSAAAAAEFVKQLQTACAEEKELRGVWVTRAEPSEADQELKLYGLVDSDPQKTPLERKARELLQKTPAWAKLTPNLSGVKPGEWSNTLKNAQKSWAAGAANPNEKLDEAQERIRQQRRQTRLDEVYFKWPDRMFVTGVCLAVSPDVDRVLEEVLKELKQPTDSFATAANLELKIDTSELKRIANPVLVIEAAAPQQGKFALDWAWYDAKGRLRLRGAVPGESSLAELEALVKGQLDKWKSEQIIRDPVDWSMEDVRVLDVAKLPDLGGKLQECFAGGDDPLRRQTRLISAVLRRDALRGLQLQATGLCIYSEFDEKKPPLDQIAAKLNETFLDLSKPAVYPLARPTGIVLKPDFLNAVQDEIDRTPGLGSEINVLAVEFNEQGKARPPIIEAATSDEQKQRVFAVVRKLLGEGAGGEEGQEEDDEEEEAPPTADVPRGLRAVELKLQQWLADNHAASRTGHIRLDRLSFRREDGKRVLVCAGVWLYENEKPNDARVEKLYHDLEVNANKWLLEQMKQEYAEAKLKRLPHYTVKRSGLTYVRSPLEALRDRVMMQAELRGVVVHDASYDKDRRLRLEGYAGSEKQRAVVVEVMQDPKLVEKGVLRKVGDQIEKPSLEAVEVLDYAKRSKEAQLKFAASRDNPLLTRLRIKDIAFVYVKNASGPPRPLLAWRGEYLRDRKAADEEPLKKTLRKELAAAANVWLPRPVPPEEINIDELPFRDTPIVGLQRRAGEDRRLDGVLFESARFNGEGLMELEASADAGAAPLVSALVKDACGDEAKVTLKPFAWPQAKGSWTTLLGVMQTRFAADRQDTVARSTRLDRVRFLYDDDTWQLRLPFEGVCLLDGKLLELKPDERSKQVQQRLEQTFKSEGPPLPRPAVVTDRTRPVKFPREELQDQFADNESLDGTVLEAGSWYDESGKLHLVIAGVKEDDPRVRALLEKSLKGTGILRPDPVVKADADEKEEAPAKGDAGYSLADMRIVDWADVLSTLRQQFAAPTSAPLFRQTRIDRARFRYLAGKLRLDFVLTTLQPPGQAAQLQADLELRLERYFTGKLKDKVTTEFKPLLPDSPFQLDPTPALQRRIVKDEALDGVLFYAAWYDPERRLHFDLLFDDTAGHEEKIKKLLATDTLAHRHFQHALLKDDPAYGPLIQPRTVFAWQEQRRALQREFAASGDALRERTRIDRLYFDYAGNDTGERRLRAEVVCLAPGGRARNDKPLAAAIYNGWSPRLVNAIQKGATPRLPSVVFTVATDDFSHRPSPIIDLQQLAVDRGLDGVLFEKATYDGAGVLHLGVYLTNPTTAAEVAALVADERARDVLRPALGLEANQDKAATDPPRPFPWRSEDRGGAAGVAARFQAHFASSDAPAARQSRVDRAYFLYEKDESRRLHLQGVSLWAGQPAALSAKLSAVSRQVLPAPDYQVADSLVQKRNPAPALQVRLGSEPRFDGVLFEDAGYDPRGRLRFPVLLANAGQEKAVFALLADPPLAEGVRPTAPERREIQKAVRVFDWADMLKRVRVTAARQPSGDDLRRTRLDRAYFARPDGLCRLHFVGVSLAEPPEEAEGAPPVRTRLAAQLKAQCDRHLSSLSLQAPPIEGRADGIELFEQSLGPIVQRNVGDQRVLDGVYVKGAGFDATGELVPEGVWVGPKQAAPLETLVRASLGMQEKRFTEAGFGWDGMRVLRSDELLRDLRKWVIDDTKAEELLFDRLFFSPLGHLRIYGAFVAPGRAKDEVVQALPGFLQKHPIGRLLLDGPPAEAAPPAGAAAALPSEAVYFRERASVGARLRGLVPVDARLDGIRLDRCYYDLDAVLVLTGLQDDADQYRLLDPLLQAAARTSVYQPQLARTWRYGDFRRVPLARMRTCLKRAMPVDPLFDGMLLDRCYHGADGRLVLAGHTTAREVRPEARQLLLQLVAKEPAWAERLAGGPLPLFQRVTADPTQVDRAFWQSVSLFITEDEETARNVLDLLVLHVPGDPTLWYFRAICHRTLGDEVLVERDLRRMLFLNAGRSFASYSSLSQPPLDVRRLERIQGEARSQVNKALDRVLLVPSPNQLLPEMLKHYCAEPTAPRMRRMRYPITVYLKPCACP